MEGPAKLHPDFLEPRWAASVGFGWKLVPTVGMFIVPLSFPTGLAATLAAAPWLPWRFNLRTLLITTTLVAVVLGPVVYATR
jgi:hypothetical protein